MFVVGGNTALGHSSRQTFSPPSNSPRWGESSASPPAGGIEGGRYLIEKDAKCKISAPRNKYTLMIEEFDLGEQAVYDRASVQMTVQDDKNDAHPQGTVGGDLSYLSDSVDPDFSS